MLYCKIYIEVYMTKRGLALLVAGIFLEVIMILGVFASDNNITIFEANIFKDSSSQNIIKIQVPDYIFLGNVTNDKLSDEVNIAVNNTGNVDITVTPQLVNSSEPFFSYLYFRMQKSSTVNESLAYFYRIGNFSFDISKPASGKNYTSKTFYAQLNLTDYPNEITSNLIGYRANVKFVAVEQ